eukprot:14489519-Heterocapsa_arctica.AAC.1
MLTIVVGHLVSLLDVGLGGDRRALGGSTRASRCFPALAVLVALKLVLARSFAPGKPDPFA